MSGVQVEILAIAAVTAMACALPGVLLVLRRMALVSDAIAHSVLLGIVLAFLVTGDLSSPLLILAAAATGVVTVVLVEILNRTRLVAEDAAIGLVFPLLFSVGVILVSRFAGDVHLDVDAVLLGELAFAPFDRVALGGVDLGPKALLVMGAILVLNALVIGAFFKELKLATFDPALAAALGLAPAFLHYLLMGLVSITAVGAFEAVGSVLVVALMIAPPATALLLSDRLWVVYALALLTAVLSAVLGYAVAIWMDSSIAGSMAVASGLLFALALVLGPERGLVSVLRRRRRQRVDFALRMLVIHLRQHEGTATVDDECSASHLTEHIAWAPAFARDIVSRAVQTGLIQQTGDQLRLTGSGITLADRSIVDVD